MTIDLKWLLPLLLPPVIAGYCLGILWLFGVPLTTGDRSGVVILSTIFGVFFGLLGAFHLDNLYIRWNIKIGGKK